MPGRIRAQAALACPVISFQTEKRSLIVARYPVAADHKRLITVHHRALAPASRRASVNGVPVRVTSRKPPTGFST